MGNSLNTADCTDVLTNTSWMESLTRRFHKDYMASNMMTGATVVICRGSAVVYRHHFGDHMPDSLYYVYSLTKIITTVACLQLQEKGQLCLDDPVSKYIPSFQRKHKVFGSNEFTEAITVRQCLNHTSGFTYYNGLVHPSRLWTESEWQESRVREPHAAKPLGDYVDEFLSSTPLQFAAGARFNYAEGHNVIASVVERLSGMPFDTYVYEHITGPLGMDDTVFLVSHAQKSRLHPLKCDWRDVDHPLPSANGVTCLRGCIPQRPPLVADSPTVRDRIRGDSGLKGSVDDWTRFNQMMLNGGSLDGARILNGSSVNVMCRSSLPGGAELCPPYAFGACEATAASFGVPRRYQKHCRPVNSYPGHTFGLGVAVVQDAVKAGLRPAANGTCWWQGLSSTYLAFNRGTDIGCLVFAQNLTCCTRQQALAHVLNAAHDHLS